MLLRYLRCLNNILIYHHLYTLHSPEVRNHVMSVMGGSKEYAKSKPTYHKCTNAKKVPIYTKCTKTPKMY